MIQHYTITGKQGVGRFMADLAKLLNGWNGETPLRIQISERKEKRSLDQNALLWTWYQIIADETGHDKEDIHNYCKSMFLGTKLMQFGHTLGGIVPLSTKNQSKGVMAEYMNKIQAWASIDLGITLPSPDEARLASL
ncbi:hypothetical protein LZG74_25400 [Dyadobacter sp. CY327]|uniref:hypothetical protein n=1 Tax=Dyadobacter sp. CY327 TaxID=2907301 RepID=UPI001F24FCDA|nr:hypothetical protein [Dyadobacter sp. CY327]MCE7073671.1 hypothetical protein [Dyadobacter sp. CY327]